MDNEKIVENIDIRLHELELQIENNQKDFLRFSEKYLKTMKMKYATRAMQATNKIKSIEKKIESYKRVRQKYV